MQPSGNDEVNGKSDCNKQKVIHNLLFLSPSFKYLTYGWNAISEEIRLHCKMHNDNNRFLPQDKIFEG